MRQTLTWPPYAKAGIGFGKTAAPSFSSTHSECKLLGPRSNRSLKLELSICGCSFRLASESCECCPIMDRFLQDGGADWTHCLGNLTGITLSMRHKRPRICLGKRMKLLLS